MDKQYLESIKRNVGYLNIYLVGAGLMSGDCELKSAMNTVERIVNSIEIKQSAKDVYIDYLRNRNDKEILPIWNKFCYVRCAFKDAIYPVSEMESQLRSIPSATLASLITRSNIRSDDEWFSIDCDPIHGWICTLYELCDTINYEELADFCIATKETFGDKQLEEALNTVNPI